MKKHLSFLVFPVFIMLIFTGCKSVGASEEKPIAILGAFADEIAVLENQLENSHVVEEGGIQFSRGLLKGRDVVVAYTGIGKVNAAMTTTLVITHFEPAGVIYTGIAGGLNPGLYPTDIVIAETCIQHDLITVYNDSIVSYRVTNPVTGEKNPVFYKSDTLWLKYLKEQVPDIDLQTYASEGQTYQPKILFGTIATGDAFVASDDKKTELKERFRADAVEMEGAAVAQICHQQHVPFIIIRSISDSADTNAEIDLEKFLSVAAENANRVVLALLQAINEH